MTLKQLCRLTRRFPRNSKILINGEEKPFTFELKWDSEQGWIIVIKTNS